MQRFENERSPVKLLSLLKIPMMLFGLAIAFVLAPACKAQSEVSPDHFDGTDSWEWAARHSEAQKPKAVPTARRSRRAKSNSLSTFQPAKARHHAKRSSRDAVAIRDTRKMGVRRLDKK